MTYADFISIHAPHAGRDQCVVGQKNARRNFNPRAPCGARPPKGGTKVVTDRFQSTRPMRGATDRRPRTADRVSISIHAPHAGRDSTGTSPLVRSIISIHAPHAGRDVAALYRRIELFISIHAPHAGRDFIPFFAASMARPFQSTRPMRGATGHRRPRPPTRQISIHAPHAGRDRSPATLLRH